MLLQRFIPDERCIDKLRSRYPPNIVRNQKYNVVSFLPIVLYEQFKFFFNLYFLLVAVSQIVPALRIGWFRQVLLPLSSELIAQAFSQPMSCLSPSYL